MKIEILKTEIEKLINDVIDKANIDRNLLTDGGKILYLNGANGTVSDWEMNGHLPLLAVCYEETGDYAVSLEMSSTGDSLIEVYTIDDKKIANLKITTGKLNACILYRFFMKEAESKFKYNCCIDEFNWSMEENELL